MTTSAVGATVTVLVTALLGATATWFFRDDGETEDDGSQDKPPFAWVVKEEGSICYSYFVVDSPPDKVPKIPENEAKRLAWVSGLGATSSDLVDLHLTLQGIGQKDVVLDSLTVKVEGTPKVDGGVFTDDRCDDPGDGQPVEVPVRGFVAQLNPRQPTIPLRPRGVRKTVYSISDTKSEVFHVVVYPGACTCDWTLQLAWTSGGESGTVTIDDDGEPFRSASTRGRVHYEYDSRDKRWVKDLNP